MDEPKDKLALLRNIEDRDINEMLQNHKHWQQRAAEHGDSHDVSWEDHNMVRMEIDNIASRLEDGSRVIDIGCSNGYTTFEVASRCDVTLTAFDYSKMSIETAIQKQKERDPERKIRFYHGNILNIQEKDALYDYAYTIRVLINLPSWELQKKGIAEVHRILKKDGCFLMSEAFVGSLAKLNQLRRAAGMKELRQPAFNLYLKEDTFEKYVSEYFTIEGISKFSSIYYVASRFLRYLTMTNDDRDSYSNDINNLFASYKETENSGDFGIQKLYILRKK